MLGVVARLPGAPIAGAAMPLGPDDVVVLANAADPDSVRIAGHYVQVRHVPPANLIALPMAAAETTTWPEFVRTVWNPLVARLLRDRWIDGVAMELTDAVGRPKIAVASHHIGALVVCRGVPLRIEHDPSLYADVVPATARAEFRTNCGAVDSELSLLAAPNYPINAFLVSPLFQNDHPTRFDEQRVVRVSRLDGPEAADACALVDRAVEAERNGVIGRGYIDLSDRDADGNRWLEAAGRELADMNVDVSVDRASAPLPLTARCDAPAWYFGWYAPNVEGPFTLPGFRFPAGAVALHIHSYSATTLHSPSIGWAGPFVAHGVTATFGNVYEPYLQLTVRPDLLVRALRAGWCLVDAAYYATQGLSWQTIVIGDPLYRPFATTLEAQVRQLDTLPPAKAGYVLVREAIRLDHDRHPDEATTRLQRALVERPSLAVAWAVLQRMRDTATTVTAVSKAVNSLPPPQPDEWGLLAAMADDLRQHGHPAEAVDLWQKLLAEPGIPGDALRVWLTEGAETARAVGRPEAKRWSVRLSELTPPAAH